MRERFKVFDCTQIGCMAEMADTHAWVPPFKMILEEMGHQGSFLSGVKKISLDGYVMCQKCRAKLESSGPMVHEDDEQNRRCHPYASALAFQKKKLEESQRWWEEKQRKRREALEALRVAEQARRAEEEEKKRAKKERHLRNKARRAEENRRRARNAGAGTKVYR